MVIRHSFSNLKDRAARWPNGKAAFMLARGVIEGDTVIVDEALQEEADKQYPAPQHFGSPLNKGRFNITYLKSSAHLLPIGYIDFILAHGTIEGEWIQLTEDAGKELRDKFPPPPSKPKPPVPTLAELAGNFSTAITNWAQAGFKVVEKETYERRHSVCVACEHWRPDAMLGIGKCRKCGCSKVKLWLATSRCPDKPPRW